MKEINPLSPELNSICYLLALLAGYLLTLDRSTDRPIRWLKTRYGVDSRGVYSDGKWNVLYG
jgi:hypothetical protein